MGSSTSRVVGCFVPNRKGGVGLEFSEPLDEGLGHSFCYIRLNPFDSPAITPSNSERFTVDSSTFDSETLSGSFRHYNLEDPPNLNKPIKGLTETTFRTISGASVSANVSTARTGNQNALFFSDAQEPAASFESTASFASIPLQPIPRGSGPLNMFMSGPLERGFASGPLDRGGGFMSGPLEGTDQSNFSAPLARGRRVGGLQRLMRSVSGPMKRTISRTFSRNTMGSSWMRRFFLHPVTQFAWQPPRFQFQAEASRSCVEIGPSDLECGGNGNDLQWAHGKAGEDRVHVVLSEEQGWLYIGIYDGFSGPDAPDFLMGHLYKAIDEELEGLLWDYDKSQDDHSKPLINRCSEATSSLTDGDKEESVTAVAKSSVSEKQNTSVSDSCSVFAGNVSSQCRKSMRLYELLQMESSDGQASEFLSEFVKQRTSSLDFQQNSSAREALEKEQLRSNSVSFKVDDHPSISGENDEIGIAKNGNATVLSVSSQWQSTRKSIIGSKIRKMHRKQKSLRKKLFPWNYDWHREETYADDQISDQLSGPIRRYVSGTVVDHDAILKALERALQKTEEAYMELVEKSLDKVPELALMGSCVLVMLMKDQDVYVMNLGDSRFILAQERSSDRIPCSSLGKDELRHGNRSRESLVRMELDRISEESPMHNQCGQIDKINKSKEISLCKLRIRAVQLSTDHCTSIKQEVLRVKSEHCDDSQAIMNNRVKGQLKVTRAFGAGFLKKPWFNDALLEMFRIDYIGTAPYVSCVPSLVHHRLTSTDRFLVLSSDGLYQYFTNEEVVAHVTWFIENVPEGDPAQYLIAELLFRAAQNNGMDFHELLDIPQGDRRKYHDDVSVMIVSLEGRIWRSSG